MGSSGGTTAGQDQGALQEELVAVALLVHRAWWGGGSGVRLGSACNM